jgi:hypothetical protein
LAHGVGQMFLLVGLFMVYRLSRHLADGREFVALEHAEHVWYLQRHLDLPSEALLQQLALNSTDLVRMANEFYLAVHFPAAIVFLLWVLVRHRDHWARVRNVLIFVTGAALVVHILYPLAPPRFLPQIMSSADFVDTGRLIGPSAYDVAGDDLANEYAAMPSLHVGWAVLEAWGIITILQARARWLAVAHPVITSFVVVITANHYWLDGIVAAALVVAAVWLTAPGVAADLRNRVLRVLRVRKAWSATDRARAHDSDTIVPTTARGLIFVPGSRHATGGWPAPPVKADAPAAPAGAETEKRPDRCPGQASGHRHSTDSGTRPGT